MTNDEIKSLANIIKSNEWDNIVVLNTYYPSMDDMERNQLIQLLWTKHLGGTDKDFLNHYRNKIRIALRYYNMEVSGRPINLNI